MSLPTKSCQIYNFVLIGEHMLVNLTQCKSRGLCLLSANYILSAYRNTIFFFFIRKYFCLELKCRDCDNVVREKPVMEACKAKKQSPNGETWLRVSEVQGGSQNMVTIGAKITGMLNILKCKSKLIWRKTWKKNKIRLASWPTQWRVLVVPNFFHLLMRLLC